MDKPLCIGVDVGTQSVKVLVYSLRTHGVVGRGQHEYELQNTRPGMAEQPPSVWEEGLQAALRDAMQSHDASEVRAVAVSGQQHGLVAMDASGEVLRPAKLWCDVESAPQAARLSELFGWNIQPGFTATKLLWLKEAEPEHFERLAMVMLPHDFINFRLSGRYAMECGDASGIGVLDVQTRTFDEQLCSHVDPKLFALLPPLVDPNAPFATQLTPAAALRYSLPESTVVAPGGGDNMMAALGSGAVRDGVLVVSLGTSGCVFGFSSKPVVDATGSVAPFCDSTGGWLPLVCTQNCAAVPEDVRRGFDLSREAIMELARETAAGCDGVNFIPYVTGERTPNWPDASGAILGLKSSRMQPGLLYRAALEGVTFTLYGGYLAMKRLGVQVTELRVVGGGSKNPLWRRIIADVFQVPLRFPAEAEAAALGAALQAAAVGSGMPVREFVATHPPPLLELVVSPDPSTVEAYQAAYERHVRLGAALFAQPKP